jgi:hypothetical protein
LYDYLLSNKRMVDIESFDPNVLHIFSKQVLTMIREGTPGWEEMVPPYVDNMIKDNVALRPEYTKRAATSWT